jgi:hypothetical protein
MKAVKVTPMTNEARFLKAVPSEPALDPLRPARDEPRRLSVDAPAWMVERLDREASRLGITRQSLIKVWLAERLERIAS